MWAMPCPNVWVVKPLCFKLNIKVPYKKLAYTISLVG